APANYTGNSTAMSVNLFFQLFPYVEQQNLYNNPVTGWNKQVIKLFLCPSDASSNNGQTADSNAVAGSSYVFNLALYSKPRPSVSTGPSACTSVYVDSD